MKPIFRDFRLAILNWLGAGVIKVTGPDTTPKPLPTVGSIYADSRIPAQRMLTTPSTINFNVTKANGGWLIQVNPRESYNMTSARTEELYLISDDADFDKELGKIIMTSCLKD